MGFGTGVVPPGLERRVGGDVFVFLLFLPNLKYSFEDIQESVENGCIGQVLWTDGKKN